MVKVKKQESLNNEIHAMTRLACFYVCNLSFVLNIFSTVKAIEIHILINISTTYHNFVIVAPLASILLPQDSLVKRAFQ